MELQRLNSELVSRLKGSSKIGSFCQCVTELVLNSLDAKALAIAIRINPVSMRIQVVDNGDGITKENMSYIGVRYMTNKLRHSGDLEKTSKYYGFRGEALANIVECSRCVIITSKFTNSSETYSKEIEQEDCKIFQTKNRPSPGTTVTVEGFFSEFPVRQNRFNADVELEELKKYIQSLVIVRPNVSFSIRNDITSELMVNSKKCNDIISSFKYIHPEINEECSLLKITKHTVTVEALLFKGIAEKRLQYLYVNKRPVSSNKIAKFINDVFGKHQVNKKVNLLDSGNKFPIYVFNIRCPYSQVDIIPEPAKTTVEFHEWDLLYRCIEKIVFLFFGKDRIDKKRTDAALPITDHINDDCGVRHIQGAFKTFGYKRPHNGKNDAADNDFFMNAGEAKADEHMVGITRHSLEEDNHKIADTTDVDVKRKTKFVKPLPIRLQGQGPEPTFQVALHKPDDAKSTLSRFTADEQKGKSLIMDMFLKSTQVFPSDENMSEPRSEETIYEMESNLFMENNYHKNVNGLSKTRSVSVNIRSTRKIRKKKHKDKQISHGIQTTFHEMVSKCVQTTMNERNLDGIEQTHNLDENWGQNYTLVFSNILQNDKEPNFKFVQKPPQTGCRSQPQASFQRCCNCDCHGGKRFQFNFANDATQHYNTRYCREGQAEVKIANGNLEEESSMERSIYFTNKPTFGKIAKPVVLKNDSFRGFVKPKSRTPRPIPNSSPYFHKPQPFNNHMLNQNTFCNSDLRLSSTNDFNPTYFSPHPYVEPQIRPNTLSHNPYDFTLGSFTMFDPQFKSTHLDKVEPLKSAFAEPRKNCLPNVTDPIFSTCPQENFVNQSIDHALVPCEQVPEENMLLDQNASNVCKMNVDDEHTTETLLEPGQILDDPMYDLKEHDINMSMIEKDACIENELDRWEKKRNNLGNSFYFNKRTGFATFQKPTENENQFKLCQRYDFLPRGMSPILKETEHVDMSLSQNKKDELLEYIMETYKNELFYVKWQNYLQDVDPKTFFEFIYQEKAREFEDCIPDITKFPNKNKYREDFVAFNKDLFARLRVIGQVDRKFIAVIESESSMLILFDQHAVHERIRLESLLIGYKNKSQACSEPTMYFLPKHEISVLKRHTSYLNSIGLVVDCFTNGIAVKALPLCLFTKFQHEPTDCWTRVQQVLVNDVVDVLKSGGNTSTGILPKIMQNILNMEACTGAVKFGDVLNKQQCEELLQKLSQCDLPFQCAHGRPTLVPLLSLNTTE